MLGLALWTLPDPLPEPTPLELELAWIDGVLERAGGQRIPTKEAFCSRAATDWPGAVNRDFVCEASEPLGSWIVRAPHGRGSIQGWLTVREADEADALELRERAISRYAYDGAGLDEGAITWCHTTLTWQGELVWTLEYGCHVSHHVSWMHELRDTLVRRGEPFLGVVGVLGKPGGWARLWVQDGGEHTPRPVQRHARVVDVEEDDVLWLREGLPRFDELRPRVGSLAPAQRCVPLMYEGHEGWWRLLVEGEVV